MSHTGFLPLVSHHITSDYILNYVKLYIFYNIVEYADRKFTLLQVTLYPHRYKLQARNLNLMDS